MPLMQLGSMDRYTSKFEDARSLRTLLALGVTANTQPQGNTMAFFVALLATQEPTTNHCSRMRKYFAQQVLTTVLRLEGYHATVGRVLL